MKVSGWITSSLDINHGQHSYAGKIKKNKVEVKIDLGLSQCWLKGKTDGKCEVTVPHVKMPEKSIKKEDPEYYKRLKDEAKLFKNEYKKIVSESFAEIKKAAEKNGLHVEAMRLKIKKSKDS
jgi:hypothetical protein